jgi:RNA polymerase sigma factor for flagellar operon FliA
MQTDPYVTEAVPPLEREKLCLTYLPMVEAIAARVIRTLPPSVEVDDLIQTGMIGLLDSFKRYDRTRMVSFANYARKRVRGAMIDHLRELDWASRSLRHVDRLANTALCDLAQTLERTPTEMEVADSLNISLRSWRATRVRLNVNGSADDCRQHRRMEARISSQCAAQADPADTMYAKRELSAHLVAAIERLPVRLQTLLSLYYDCEVTMKDIGARLGVNESRVSQMHASGLRKLGATLQLLGISSSRG